MSTQNLRMWPYLEIGSLQMQLVRMRSSWIKKKAIAPHSSILAWKIPGTGEPGRLQSMGSRRVGYNRDFIFTFMHWRRKWQPTPVFLPGESQGRGSLVGCHLWGHDWSDFAAAVSWVKVNSKYGSSYGYLKTQSRHTHMKPQPLECQGLPATTKGWKRQGKVLF